ncbi:ATP-binding protein [Streptomyces pseudovenezuelae]|uniref:ATP-binding protein n=1 Tax=Streptomyces pseudovenezuelae TaxID=67350 RepID=UPI002475F153|nr:regulator [Streptomyces pseudovenezuelae]
MSYHLPPVLPGFVGRERELPALTDALREHRLISLTGAGGVGKSRLSLHAAHGFREATGREVAWADLWQLPDDRLLVAAVADALGFADHTPAVPLDALGGWLADEDPLLVLDSCEHLLDGCRSLVSQLLRECPKVSVLVTSREPLGVPGERCVALGPLPFGSDALSLLERLADDAGRPLTGTADMMAATRLCARLEGVPLAIELASGQLAERDIHQVDRELAQLLDLQTPRPRGGPRRHQALRTTIGWSHELCAPAERLLWARVSAFRGPMGADAVREVCTGGPLAPEDVEAALAGLVRKSVLTRSRECYRMLDTVREYGRMWLDALAESDRIDDRHALHHARTARRADQAWFGADQVHWYRWISASHVDLCSALDHLLATDPEAAVEMAGHLGFFWSCCGHLPEADRYLEEALRLSSAPGPARNRALWALGVVRVLRGEHEAGRDLARACRHQAEQTGDTDAVLRAAYLLALTHLLGGRPLAAEHVVDTALAQVGGSPARTQTGGWPALAAPRAMCRLARVFAHTARGLLDRAREGAEELRRESMERGEWWTRSYADYQLALIALFEDRADSATAHAISMLEGKLRIGDSFGLALGLDLLASALAAQGAAERAVAAHTAAERYWNAVGHPQRGTPELGPVRDRYEATARSQLGDAGYDEAAARAMLRGPGAITWELLGRTPPGR